MSPGDGVKGSLYFFVFQPDKGTFSLSGFLCALKKVSLTLKGMGVIFFMVLVGANI